MPCLAESATAAADAGFDHHAIALRQSEALGGLLPELLDPPQNFVAKNHWIVRKLHLFVEPGVVGPANSGHLHAHEPVVIADLRKGKFPKTHDLFTFHHRRAFTRHWLYPILDPPPGRGPSPLPQIMRKVFAGQRISYTAFLEAFAKNGRLLIRESPFFLFWKREA